MTTCPNLIAICSQTHQQCTHCGVDGKCDSASCVNAAIPTWSEVVEIYTVATGPSVRRLKSINTAIRNVVSRLGMTMDEKAIVTAEDMDELYDDMKGNGVSPFTIQTYFSELSAVTNSRRRSVKLEYRKRGMTCPDIDLPEVKTEIGVNTELTEEQKLAVRDEMAWLRHSESETDHRRFVWLWFAWYFGVRPADIGKLTWSCISRHPSGKMWLSYVPGKTAKKCKGRRAGGEITNEQFVEIKPFVGKPDEYVIPRLANRCSEGARRHGEFDGYHRTLRKYTICFMKSIGVTDRKPQYALRKDCAATTIANEGIVREAQKLGHTPKVATENYVNFVNLELKGE